MKCLVIKKNKCLDDTHLIQARHYISPDTVLSDAFLEREHLLIVGRLKRFLQNQRHPLYQFSETLAIQLESLSWTNWVAGSVGRVF